MKHTSGALENFQKSRQRTNRDLAHPNARSLRPPRCGMEFVDEILLEHAAIRPESQRAPLTAAILQQKAFASQPIEDYGVAAPIQGAGLQGSPDVPVRLPDHGGGAEMPKDVRAKMEAGFGVDFSMVRIHEGAYVQAVGALAYTQGTDIHFAPGQYHPRSQRGEELLGHELTHVVQQSRGRVQATMQAKGVSINTDPVLEREADEMGAWVKRNEVGSMDAKAAGGHRVTGPSVGSHLIQRRVATPEERAALDELQQQEIDIQLRFSKLSQLEQVWDYFLSGGGSETEAARAKYNREALESAIKRATDGEDILTTEGPVVGTMRFMTQREADMARQMEVGRALAFSPLSSGLYLGSEIVGTSQKRKDDLALGGAKIWEAVTAGRGMVGRRQAPARVPFKFSSSTKARVLAAAVMRGVAEGAPLLRGTGAGLFAVQRPHSAPQAPAEMVTTSPPMSARPAPSKAPAAASTAQATQAPWIVPETQRTTRVASPSKAPAAASTAQATQAPKIVPETQPPTAVASPQVGPSASQSGIPLDRSGTWQANQPESVFGMYSEEELSVETSSPGSSTLGTSFELRNELTPEIMDAQRQKNVPESGRALGSPGTAQHGESESRSGMAFREYDAAEVALSMRTDYSPEHGGYLRWVEFDVPQVTGNFGTRPGVFRQNDALRAIGVAHPAHEDLTNTQSERGHAAGQQLSGGDRDVAEALMVTTNMWPMSGRGPAGVNQGAYKRFEEVYIALKADNPGSSVHVRVEAVVGSSPRFVQGTQGRPVLSPEAFNITVTFTPALGGGPPIVINFILPN